MDASTPADGDAPPRLLDRAAIAAGMRRCLPIGISVFAYGLVYGALAAQAGLSLAEATAMSALVFAGTAQFVVLGLWAAPLPVAAILAATLLLNLRLVLMGATLRRACAGLTTRQALAVALLVTDENWALTMREANGREANGREANGREASGRKALAAFFIGTGIVLYVAWIAAAIAGYLVGSAVGDPKRLGLDFAFVAMFLALAVALGRRQPNPAVWLVSAAAAILAERLLGGSWHILVGGLAGAAAAGLWRPGGKHAR